MLVNNIWGGGGGGGEVYSFHYDNGQECKEKTSKVPEIALQ